LLVLAVQTAYPTPIDIDLDHPEYAVNTDALTSLIQQVVKAEGGDLRYIGVILTGHDTVRSLNRQYLDHDYNTDVLAFSLADPAASNDADTESEPTPIVEGEVYVDLDTAAERHDEFDATFEEEVRRYVVHGTLHLLGYDDGTESGNREMRRLENAYLGDD